MKKKDKMKRLGVLLLVITAITVIITFVIVMNMSDSTEQTQPVVLEEVSEEKQETGDKKLAMPVYTKEELLEKAEADGDEPEVIEDEVSGVTLVDYSDVL